MTGLIKLEQTDTGHMLVCEGHKPRSILPTLISACPPPQPRTQIQDGSDPPKNQITKALTVRERERERKRQREREDLCFYLL